jgi:predicted DNA-binding transcriptional regulator AlpA
MKPQGRQEKPSDGFAYPPRGMSADQAASYVGLGRTKFLEMVGAGHMPKPIDLDGSTRWDRVDLDRKMDDLKETKRDAPPSLIDQQLDRLTRGDHEIEIGLRSNREGGKA